MAKSDAKERYSHLRTRALNKPQVYAPEIHFYHCPCCNNMLQSMSEQTKAPNCCGQEMEELPLFAADAFEPEVSVTYTIMGSLNENAVKAMWDCKNWQEKPKWVLLRTFMGNQLKFNNRNRRTYFMFGLADDDSYAYCDKDPCIECRFRCKKGFGLYFYFEGRGLIYMPLTRSEQVTPSFTKELYGDTIKLDVN